MRDRAAARGLQGLERCLEGRAVKNPFEDQRHYTGKAPGGKAQGEQKKNGKANSATPVIIRATPYEWVDERDIPGRDFLGGNSHHIRGNVVMDVAAGGVGKTAFNLVEAVGMATGKDL